MGKSDKEVGGGPRVGPGAGTLMDEMFDPSPGPTLVLHVTMDMM